MCALSAVLRTKPQWWTKYTDSDIRARWKTEAVGAPVPYGDIHLKDDEVEYVLDELAHFAAQRDPITGVEVCLEFEALDLRLTSFRPLLLCAFGSRTT